MRIGIIGGGIMGLVLAELLGRKGHATTVFESEGRLGGLATYHDFGPFVWDRFYHVILPTDTALTAYLEEIGLHAELRWRGTRTGYFVDQQMYSISNNVEFLKFPKLSMAAKLRLGISILLSSRINDWRRLEKVRAVDWLQRLCGREAYENFWKPLLLAKLGENYDRVSAVFIWSYVKRLYSARNPAVGREQLGHVAGGYRVVLETLQRRIEAQGGDIRLRTPVTAVEADGARGVSIVAEGEAQRFDKVVCTSPVSIVQRIVSPALLSGVSGELDRVEYLGVICPAVISREPLVPFYVVNIAEPSLPFTGVIGMSTVVDTEETAGRYLTYLPRYVSSTSDELNQDDEQIVRRWREALARMLPQAESAGIERIVVNRARKVQPLQVLGYSDIAPKAHTDHPDLYLLNTSQLIFGTLNNNGVVGLVNKFVGEREYDFPDVTGA